MQHRDYFGTLCKTVPLVLFLFIAVAAAGCRPVQIWNVPLDVMARKLEEGDRDFLRSLEYSQVKLEEVLVLGRGAPFYLARIYGELDMRAMEEAMYRLQLKQGADIWAKNSAIELHKMLIGTDRDADALAAARLAKALFPQDKDIARFELEALYWLKTWDKVIEILTPQAGTPERLTALAKEDPEKLLFYVVALHETGGLRRREALTALLTETKPSGIDVRAYQFFTRKENPLPDLPMPEKTLLEARFKSASGDGAAASKLYDTLLVPVNASVLTRHILEDAALNYIRSARQNEGIQKLSGLESISGLRIVVNESIGRLYRTSNKFTEGASFFLKALSTDQPPEDYDRILWYYLDCLFKSDKPLFLAQIMSFAKTWHSPSYFSDILESVSVFYTGERDWKNLENLYLAVGPYGDDESVSRFAFILARAIQRGLYVSGGDATAVTMMEDIKIRRNNQYYRFLSSAITKDPSYLFDLPPAKSESGTSASKGRALPEDEFISGYLHFGLYREAYAKARELRDLLSPRVIITLAEKLAGEEMFLQSINAIYLYIRRPDSEITNDVFTLAFPRGYANLMHKYVRKEALNTALFYALVREESYFDPEITSWAGAVGLSQLMPATAAEVASQLKMENPNLKDPETNLAIGAKYFHSMLTRFVKGYQAVAAYNAGPTRIRQWRALFDGLPDELFAEAIPFKETRGHVRKILVTSVMYAHLYENKKPWETIPFMFPDLGGEK